MRHFPFKPTSCGGRKLCLMSALMVAACGSSAGEHGGGETKPVSSREEGEATVSRVKEAFVAAATAASILLAKRPAKRPKAAPIACSFTAWVDGQNYSAGHIVKYPANNKFYKVVHDNPGYDPTISTWYWDVYPCDPATSTDISAPPLPPASLVVTEAQFNQMFPTRNAFYSYAGLVAAAAWFPTAFNSGDDTVRKQEAAAFLANVAHETGGLVYLRESNQANWPYYCESSAQYPCAPGQQYYGRGPIQLSWNYNYGAAGDALGLNLLADPDLVARDSLVAWKTALWFWMTQTGSASLTPHDAMVKAKGFGETIRAINGDLECGQAAGSLGEQQMRSRVANYKNFTQLLGVEPGNKRSC